MGLAGLEEAAAGDMRPAPIESAACDTSSGNDEPLSFAKSTPPNQGDTVALPAGIVVLSRASVKIREHV